MKHPDANPVPDIPPPTPGFARWLVENGLTDSLQEITPEAIAAVLEAED